MALIAIVLLAMALKIVTQYQRGVLFRLGRVIGTKEPGLHVILPVIDRLNKVSLRIVTQPIQSQGNHHSGQRQCRYCRCCVLSGSSTR